MTANRVTSNDVTANRVTSNRVTSNRVTYNDVTANRVTANHTSPLLTPSSCPSVSSSVFLLRVNMSADSAWSSRT